MKSSTSSNPSRLVDTLGYFFLLPNYAFLLFRWSTTDHEARLLALTSTRLRHRSADDLQCVVQLLAYRLVYHEL